MSEIEGNDRLLAVRAPRPIPESTDAVEADDRGELLRRRPNRRDGGLMTRDAFQPASMDATERGHLPAKAWIPIEAVGR